MNAPNLAKSPPRSPRVRLAGLSGVRNNVTMRLGWLDLDAHVTFAAAA